MMQYCVTTGFIENDPTIGVKARNQRSTGIHTWSEPISAMPSARLYGADCTRIAARY
jgi:hypothetical protein